MAERKSREAPSAKTLSELSALADGTLDPRRTAAVGEEIARSPGLRERYARELRAVEALRATRYDPAPPRLRAQIEAERRRAVGQSRRGFAYGGAIAAAAAVIVALVLVLPGGTPGSPSVSQAAGLALRGPALGAPGVGSARGKLDKDVQEVYFPNWSRVGWAASGQRADTFAGRSAVTVYYDHGGMRIAYTILSAPALRWPRAQTRWLHGTKLQSFRLDGRMVVTWRRAGHTCILSGAAVSPTVLSELAAWKTPG